MIFLICHCVQVYKVIAADGQVYAMKEVYLKRVDKVVKQAYIQEIKFLEQLKGRKEVITLHDL